jgi:hypothetical protein
VPLTYDKKSMIDTSEEQQVLDIFIKQNKLKLK